MGLTSRIAYKSESDLRRELDDLRRSLLRMLLPLVLGLAWTWFVYNVSRHGILGKDDVPVLILALATCLSHKLQRRLYKTACWVLALGMILAVGIAVATHPAPLAVAFGALVIVVSNALLGNRAALVTATIVWGAASLAGHIGAASGTLSWGAIDLLALYGLTWGATCVAARPLNTSVEWALAGWAQAHDALLEVRERRAELYRVVRALEESTYRIERMNSELIVARREAELARALKARLAATVSHELRGPLNLILGFCKLIAFSPESYREPLPRAYRADVHTIYRNSLHLATLVDDVLDLSRIEAQRLPLEKDPIDLADDVVAKVVNIVQSLAERKGLYLRQELDGSLPWILADQVRLRQVLLNLLTNAIRSTEQGGITVRTSRRGDMLLVSVRDTGRGVCAEELPRIFREFHQPRVGETDGIGGSGLGLSISKHLVELHGGEIWVESKEGAGAKFSFTVPLPGTEPATATSVKTQESRRHAGPQDSCLVVHDDPGIVRLLARHIEGYRVVGIAGEQEVIALTEELHPRAIVTTPQLATHIEDQLRGMSFDVPIVTCVMPRMEENHLEGIVSYLVKPVEPETLAAVMRRVERDGEMIVLLVDDDPDAVRLWERMMTAIPHPFHILKAYDGFQALEVMQEVVPDVVLMDLVMPGIDGIETIARMRASEQLREVPVVIVSARDRIEEGVTLGTPITVRCGQRIEIGQAAKCLQSLLDALSPRYLPRLAELEPSPAKPLDQPASAAPAPRPTPGQAVVG